MGSELVIVRWCDHCRARGDDVAEHRVRVDEIDRVVDLCSACFDTFLGGVVEAFADLGQPAPAPKSHKRKEPAQPAAAVERAPRTVITTPRVPCPLCTSTSSTHNGLKQHVKVKHGMTWTQYLDQQQPQQERLTA